VCIRRTHAGEIDLHVVIIGAVPEGDVLEVRWAGSPHRGATLECEIVDATVAAEGIVVVPELIPTSFRPPIEVPCSAVVLQFDHGPAGVVVVVIGFRHDNPRPVFEDRRVAI